VPPELFRLAREHWFATGGTVPMPVLARSPVRVPDQVTAPHGEKSKIENRKSKIAIASHSPTGDHIDLDIYLAPGQIDNRKSKIGILLKLPFHPHWRAFSSDGASLPLYSAGFGMLLLASPGRVSVQYETGSCELVGRAATLLALGALAAVFLVAVWRRSKWVTR